MNGLACVFVLTALAGCGAAGAPQTTPATPAAESDALEADRRREQACLDSAPGSAVASSNASTAARAPELPAVAHGQFAAPLPPAAAATPAGSSVAQAGPASGCIMDVDDLPEGRGATARDNRRLHDGRVLVAAKSAHRMMLYDAGELQACWQIGLGFNPVGHKRVEGDGATPEGWYQTSDKPWSIFDNAIAIHYPATRDAAEARRDGRIGRSQFETIAAASKRGAVPPQRTPMGGAVLIHGGGNSADWTLGCIAMDDDDLVDLRNRLTGRMRTKLLVVP